jgi:hypothetical protein
MGAFTTRKRWVARALLFLVPLAALGCGQAVGDVSGRVTYRGSALPSGTVTLLASDGKPYWGPIQADGTYQVPGVPVGKAQVCVTSYEDPAPRGPKPGGTGRLSRQDRPEATGPAPRSRIPAKYESLQFSGLEVEVRRGETPFDVTLPGNP